MQKFLIYMDLCCFNRPFDDQSQEIVRLETEAKLYIQQLIRDRQFRLVWSFMLKYENSFNPNYTVLENIALWQTLSEKTIMPDERILSVAKEIMHDTDIGQKDAIHCSCAIFSKCDYFITVDKKLLRKINTASLLRALNPLDFILLLEDK